MDKKYKLGEWAKDNKTFRYWDYDNLGGGAFSIVCQDYFICKNIYNQRL